MASVPCPMPATRTARPLGGRSTTAAAPSEIGQQWKRRSGSATSRLSITVSSVTGSWKCANGFRAPLRVVLDRDLGDLPQGEPASRASPRG